MRDSRPGWKVFDLTLVAPSVVGKIENKVPVVAIRLSVLQIVYGPGAGGGETPCLAGRSLPQFVW